MSSIDDRIVQVEHYFGVRFPLDYRDFLGTTGSLSQFVPPTDDFLVIDALDELIGINEAGEFQKRFPGAVVIGGRKPRAACLRLPPGSPASGDTRRLRRRLVIGHPPGNVPRRPAGALPSNRVEMGRHRSLALLTTALTECVPEPVLVDRARLCRWPAKRRCLRRGSAEGRAVKVSGSTARELVTGSPSIIRTSTRHCHQWRPASASGQ